MPTITVKYEPATVSAVLEPSSDLSKSIWIRVTQACVQAEPNATVKNERVELSWAAALPAILQLGQLRRELGFSMVAVGEADAKLREFKNERRVVQAARETRFNTLRR